MKKLYSLILILMYLNQIATAQCLPDRHSTNWYDGWISCEMFPNPNSTRGLSHWILYDLNQTYRIGKAHIWNVNDPNFLNRGIRQMVVDYSIDGLNWMEAGEYTLEQGPGISTYEGTPGPDLGGVNARYLLITALDNYGGACCGLSEVRWQAEDAEVTNLDEVDNQGVSCFTSNLYPNPFVFESRLMIQTSCDMEISYQMTDVLGRIIRSGQIPGGSGVQEFVIDGQFLPAGTYILSVRQGSQISRRHFMKID